MLTAILIGALIGFILAIPPGPVSFACIKVGLQNGRKECFELSLGSALMDTFYCVLAIFAATAVFNTLNGYLDSYPLVYLTIQVGVVVGLIYYGMSQFRKRQIKPAEIETKPQPKFIQTLKSRGPFLLGIAFAMSNIANPSFMTTLFIMTAWVRKLELFAASFSTNMLFSLGFGVGNFIWLFLLAYIVHMNKHKLSETSITRIKQFAGLTFIGFGGILGWRVVTLTNWANVFKFAIVF